MAETGFSLKYDGPALETGRMPVGEVAPALLALGALFSRSSELLHPEWPKVSLSIEANTERGSFLVHLLLESESVWDQLTGFFTSDNITALANIKTLILDGTLGLFVLFQRQRGVKPTEVQPIQPGYVRVTFPDGTVVEMPAELLKLYEDKDTREQAVRVVDPVRREGVDLVRFYPSDESEPLTITKDDLDAFDLVVADDDDVQLIDDWREMFLEVRSVTFAGPGKWKFSDGSRVIPVRIADEEFKNRVAAGEAFSAGDLLRCRVHVTQRQNDAGLYTDYTVEQVLEHVRRQRPKQLEFDPDNDVLDF